MKRERLWYFLFFALIFYLLVNTPLVSDDIAHTANAALSRDKGIAHFLLPREGWITTPLENYTHRIWYSFFSFDNLILVNVVKIAYVILSFYLVTKFFSIYLKGLDIFLASFLFIFFPSHDSTVFWFLGQHLTLSIAFYLYAYYLAYNNRFFSAGLMAIAGSFVSYGSPPIAIALFLIFILDKKLKKGLVMLIPNVFYLIYYIFVTQGMNAGVNRIPQGLDIFTVIRQFFLQVLTFIDATIGPSMWLKITYSFSELSLISVVVGIVLVIGTVLAVLVAPTPMSSPRKRGSRVQLWIPVFAGMTESDGSDKHSQNRPYDPRLIIGLAVLTISSFLMFAITGLYPQMAFNLGNRATIFGSLFIVYLIVLLPVPKIVRSILFILMFFCILGISDHWKSWGIRQEEVITNIRNNQNIADYKDDRTIYISGNQFSKFGQISHIEFLSETGAFYNFFKYAFGREIPVRAFNKRFKYTGGYLVDTKYGEKQKVDRYINVYDSGRDRLFKLYEEEIYPFIRMLPHDNRHWIQFIGNKRLRRAVLKLMPRLEYAF